MSGETFCLLGLDSLGTKDSLSPIGDNVVCLENNSSGMVDNRGLFGPDLPFFGDISCPSDDNLVLWVEMASLSWDGEKTFGQTSSCSLTCSISGDAGHISGG